MTGPIEEAKSHITVIGTQVNRLGWDQERTMQHLTTGLNNQLKPLGMMERPANVQGAFRAISTAKEAAKTQTAQWDAVHSTLKDLVTQLKIDREDKKVSAIQPSPSEPSESQKCPEMTDQEETP